MIITSFIQEYETTPFGLGHLPQNFFSIPTGVSRADKKPTFKYNLIISFKKEVRSINVYYIIFLHARNKSLLKNLRYNKGLGPK